MTADQPGSLVLLGESECEKDLGVYIDRRMTFNRHVYEAIAKANRLLGTISIGPTSS